MAPPLFFAPLRTPVVDPSSPEGLMSRDWYLFFQALWIRSGGALGSDAAELLPASDDLSHIDGLAASFGQLPQIQPLIPVDSLAFEIAELRAQVAELLKAVQDIKQGQVIL